MMLPSITEIDLKARGDLHGALTGFCINYLLLSGLILGMSFFLRMKICARIGSRHLMKARIDPVPPINLGFFLVIYIVIGLNSNSMFGVIPAVGIIAFVRTFLVGGAVYLATKLAGIKLQKRISFTLFASFKNLGS